MSCGYLTTLLNEAQTLWERGGPPSRGGAPSDGPSCADDADDIESGGTAAALTGPTSRGD